MQFTDWFEELVEEKEQEVRSKEIHYGKVIRDDLN